MLKKSLVAACLAMTLSGCAVLPQKPLLSSATVAETQGSITDGRTTVVEIMNNYGEPIARSPVGNGSTIITWHKTWADLGFKAADTTRLTVLVKDAVVVKHITYRYPVTERNSFLQSATEEGVAGKIQKGVSTKATMESAFGQPRGYVFDEKARTVMLYTWDNISDDMITAVPFVGGLAGTQSGTIVTLGITLNENNTVETWHLDSSKASRGVGVMNASALKIEP